MVLVISDLSGPNLLVHTRIPPPDAEAKERPLQAGMEEIQYEPHTGVCIPEDGSW